jgi:DNA-binding transcriptional regulator YhcF (GntR family)
MSALPENIIPFELPKRKPRVVQREAEPDQRKVCVLPIKAVFDQRLTHGALQVLAAVCAFANRAGITWVSQTRLAKDLGISQQAVAKQFKQLREHGYLETVRKGFKGERTDTLRVIFDPTVDAATAIAVTSAIEDTRPPVMQKEQAMEAEQPDPEGQRRVAQAIAQVLKTPPKRTHTMPKQGDTRAVREIKEANKKALAKRTREQANHNPQVVNEEAHQVVNAPVDNSSHSQPNHNLQVVQNTERTPIDKVKDKNINKLNIVLNNQELFELIETGLTESEIAEDLDILLPLFQAEGINPSSRVLADSILQLHRDAR